MVMMIMDEAARIQRVLVAAKVIAEWLAQEDAGWIEDEPVEEFIAAVKGLDRR